MSDEEKDKKAKIAINYFVIKPEIELLKSKLYNELIITENLCNEGKATAMFSVLLQFLNEITNNSGLEVFKEFIEGLEIILNINESKEEI